MLIMKKFIIYDYVDLFLNEITNNLGDSLTHITPNIIFVQKKKKQALIEIVIK